MRFIVALFILFLSQLSIAETKRVSDEEVGNARWKAYKACGYVEQKELLTVSDRIACKKAFYEYESLAKKQRQEEIIFRGTMTPFSEAPEPVSTTPSP